MMPESLNNTTASLPNGTESLPSVWSLKGPEFIAALVVLGIFGVLGIVGNAIVVSVIGFSRRHGQRSNVQLFLFHLALSDLMVCFVCIPLTIMINFYFKSEKNDLDEALCKVARFTQFLAPASSICILAVISIDRYYSLVRPLRVKKYYLRPKFLIGGAWIYSAVIFLPTFYFAMPELISTSQGDLYYCITIPNNTPAGSAYLIFLFIAGFAVPFITMVILYYRIGRAVWHRQRKISRSTAGTISAAHMDVMERSKKRVTRMLLIVVVVFSCCWAPFVAYTGFIERWVASFPNPMDTARFVTYCVGLFNSICNPLIYYFSSEDLRKESLKYVCIEVPTNRKSTLRNLINTANSSPLMNRLKKISRDMTGKVPQQQQPVPQQQQPVPQQQQPVSQEQQPVPLEQQPVSQEQQPVSQEQQPVPLEQQPVLQLQQPVPLEQQRVIQEQKPVSQETFDTRL